MAISVPQQNSPRRCVLHGDKPVPPCGDGTSTIMILLILRFRPATVAAAGAQASKHHAPRLRLRREFHLGRDPRRCAPVTICGSRLGAYQLPVHQRPPTPAGVGHEAGLIDRPHPIRPTRVLHDVVAQVITHPSAHPMPPHPSRSDQTLATPIQPVIPPTRSSIANGRD